MFGALSAQAIVFQCGFTFITYTYVGRTYDCKANVINTGNVKILDEVRGNHQSGKNNFDVEALNVQNQDLKYIPKGVAAFFPNIKVLIWFNSNLWELSTDDLRPFPFLMYLNVQTNKLVSLDADLFKFTPRLQFIMFSDNLLYHVGEEILSRTPFLTEARFQRNPCINDYETSRSNIPRLNDKLPVNCPPLATESTTLSSASTVPMSQCADGCLQLIASLSGQVLRLADSYMNHENRIVELEVQIKELIEQS